MRIQVRVMPRSKNRGVIKLEDGTWLVRVTEPAQNGKANTAVLEELARHFGIPKTSLSIVLGSGSRLKVIEIPA
jgi:hypothetical protein